MSRLFRLVFFLLVIVSCILVFLLVAASQNTVFFEKYYTSLIGINAVGALFFLGIIIYYCVKFFRYAKKQRYGIKILRKLVVALVITGVVPGVLIFAVSVHFLYQSVDSWFDVRVERALDSGLTLGREVLENYQQNLLNRANRMAQELAQTSPKNWVSRLNYLREREGGEEALLVSASGKIIAVSGAIYGKIVPTAPNQRILQDALQQGYWQQLDDENVANMVARVVVPLKIEENLDRSFSMFLSELRHRNAFILTAPVATEFSQNGGQVFLEVTDRVPALLASNAQMLMNGYRDYQEMIFARDGLRNIYLMTLTFVLLLSLFSGMTLSVFLASRWSHPLMALLEGTRKVGEGHYEMVKESSSNDEIGELSRSFNIMIAQLASTRQDLENRGKELEEAKSYLERILSKMSSGVIVVDSNWTIMSVNPSASRIMCIDLVSQLGTPLSKVLPAFYDELKARIPFHHGAEQKDISFQAEFVMGSAKPKRINVFTRGTELQIGSQKGFILVFDDISQLISAQRIEAWGEVARRLAHEIKNPLTPIRLAAERLQLRLVNKVQGRDQEILTKATTTIVDQVTAMKQMVDDFRTYAKLGAPRYEKLNLPMFVREVTALYEAANVKVILDLDDSVPEIEGDPNQLRQALHNLFSNAMEATRSDRELVVKILVRKVEGVDDKSVGGVELRFEDNGTGFSSQILEHAFEPYVTTKVSGTGLGLPMIKKIAEEHGATVSVENIQDENGTLLGATVSMVFRLFVESDGKRLSLR